MRDRARVGVKRGGWRIPGDSFFAPFFVVFSVSFFVTFLEVLGCISGVIFVHFSLLFSIKKL